MEKIKYYKHEGRSCPLCRSNRYPNVNKESCHPLSRIVIKGFLFWAKPCPLYGTHIHCRCTSCDFNWIIDIEDKSANEVFSKDIK